MTKLLTSLLVCGFVAASGSAYACGWGKQKSVDSKLQQSVMTDGKTQGQTKLIKPKG